MESEADESPPSSPLDPDTSSTSQQHTAVTSPRARKRKASPKQSKLPFKKQKSSQPESSPVRPSQPSYPAPTEFNPTDFYTLEEENPVNFRGGYVKSRPFRVRLTKVIPGEGIERLEYIMTILKHAFESIIRQGDPDTIAQVFMRNANMYNTILPTRRLPLSELSYDHLLEKLYEAEQSSGITKSEDDGNSVVRLEDTTFTLVTFQRQQVGGGRPKQDGKKKTGGGMPVPMAKRTIVNIWDWAKNKRCIINPMNKTHRIPKDLLKACIPYSIIIGQYLCEKSYIPREKGDVVSRATGFIFKYAQTPECRNRVRKLIRDAGLKGPGPFEINDVAKFKAVLGEDFQINIYERSAPPTTSFGTSEAPHHINLLIKDNFIDDEGQPISHCAVITSMVAFMGKRKFCKICKKTGSEDGVHKCSESKCKECCIYACTNQEPRRTRQPYKQCDSCNYTYFTEACFEAHKAESCKNAIRCLKCYSSFTPNKYPKHPCGQQLCRHCGKVHMSSDFCYVMAEKNKEQPHLREMIESQEAEDLADEELAELEDEDSVGETVEIWYADAETVVDPVTGQHTANLVILQSPVKDGPPAEKVYRGPDAMRQFTEECIRKDSAYKDSTIIWHNASKFDAHLWFRELMILETPPKAVFKGQSIIGMNLRQNKIKCRDSLQFMPGTPLAKFPSMFGLASGPKGDFPHGLNTHDWVSFTDRIVYEELDTDGTKHRFPQLHYFHPGNKRQTDREALEAWHRKQVDKYAADLTLEYVASEELESYCRQDVRILLEGFEKYRANWLEQLSDMDPVNYLTFPSFNNAIFRTKFMKPGSICLLPPMGYQDNHNRASKEAFAWLSCMERELEESGQKMKLMRDARRGFEVKIGGLKVDGFGVDRSGTKHVFQYHGCYFHGCPCQDKPGHARTEQDRNKYENTLDQNERLQRISEDVDSPYGLFVFHVIFGCEFKKQRQDNHLGWYKPHIDSFYKRWEVEPLRPREALHGGRTNCIQHSVEVDLEKEDLYYLDFNSHYPAVNYGMHGETWPIGMPKFYIGMDVDKAPSLDKSFGLWKCTVFPPRKLRQPVLGVGINDKYVFHLCTTCATEQREGPCDHEDTDRKLSGVFFTEELKLAVEKGYRIGKVSEIWDWDEDHRDPNLFRDFIRSQYKRKACASVVSDEELDEVIKEYAETMGLVLTREDFQANSAMRALAKFSLNNIWGYFGKRGDEPTTFIARDLSELTAIDNDPTREIVSLQVIMGGELLQIQHKPKVEPANRNGNIVIAAMTTAYARIELYRQMDKYSDQVVYFDTDSMFLLLPKGMEPPPSSKVLGGLKDEIKDAFGPGHHITSFHSLGPKTYTYTVADDDGVVKHVELKAKGISLSSDALGVVSSDSMKKLLADRTAVVRVPQFQIGRKVAEGSLFSHDFDKAFRFASTKRRFLPGPNPRLDTLPYGYCE